MNSRDKGRTSAIILVITILMMAVIVGVMIVRGEVERTSGPISTQEVKPQNTEAEPVTLMAPTTATAAELTGTHSLDTDCAPTLVIANGASSDVVVSIYLETATATDEHEDVVPAHGKLSLTLIREAPINYVFVREASGNGDPVIDWAPDYGECKSDPAVTPPTGGVGDSQQIERPAPEAPTTTVEPPVAVA